VRHIELHENIGHWHFAHSYVRGNWSREKTSGPILLTKSSHDLDILHWLTGERVESVVSYGGLTYFREENAPPEAAERCVDCSLRNSCIYSATEFYLRWRDDLAAQRRRAATGYGGDAPEGHRDGAIRAVCMEAGQRRL
jgi:predicted dehydrogenase